MTVRDLVVIGGGIAGLVIAHDAARAGLEVELLEADDVTGGLLRGTALGGRTIDIGAESFATRTTGVAELLADVAPALRTVTPAAAGAHLAFAGAAGTVQHAPLPRRTVLGIPADPLADDVVRIIGPDAASRAAAERTMPALAGPEPSLAELVAERCGAVLVRRLVDPLCRSVYSRPASAVRLSDLHPTLWRAFTATGSLLDAAAAVAAGPRAGSAVAGIDGGMWQLPAAVRAGAQQHGAVIRTGAAVTALAPGEAAAPPRVSTADGATVSARRVVVATGSRAARALLAPGGPAPAADHARVRVIVALVRATALDGHPVGSGVIVAPEVLTAAKALTHVTAKWAWAADAAGADGDGRHVVRLSARDADAPGLDSHADVAREIAQLTGVAPDALELLDMADRVWADAVAAPPVDAAHDAALARTGIHLAGAAAAGTGLASVIPHARALARDLIAASTSFSQGRVHV